MISLDFTDRTVLVTGASRGIGLAIAQAFSEANAIVHITGTGPIESYDADLSAFIYHQVSLGVPEDRQALAAAVGALDVLVNNAAMAGANEYEIGEFEAVIQVNLIAAADLCFRFKDALAERKGAIVNVGSLASFISLRRTPAYTASKAGMLGLTRAMADEWSRLGVRINMVAPGFIETRMNEWARTDENAERRLVRSIPMKRLGQPQDVANAVLFFASPASAYVTGQSLIIDGGLVLR